PASATDPRGGAVAQHRTNWFSVRPEGTLFSALCSLFLSWHPPFVALTSAPAVPTITPPADVHMIVSYLHEEGFEHADDAHHTVWRIGDHASARRAAAPADSARAGAAGLPDRASRRAAKPRQAGRPAVAGSAAAPGPAYAL